MAVPTLSPLIIDSLRAQIAAAGLAGSLGEHLSTALLQECGLTMNAGMLVNDAGELASVAEQLHYPVVLKTAAVEHKSDVGGVILSIATADDLIAAYEELADRLGPEAYIAPMIDAPGVEMTLGAYRDPQRGPMVTLGLVAETAADIGAEDAETPSNLVMLAAPFGAATAQRALAGLEPQPPLDSAQGADAVDMNAFCEMAARLSALMHALADCVIEVDINPVKVGAWGVVGLDALVVLSDLPREDSTTCP